MDLSVQSTVPRISITVPRIWSMDPRVSNMISRMWNMVPGIFSCLLFMNLDHVCCECLTIPLAIYGYICLNNSLFHDLLHDLETNVIRIFICLWGELLFITFVHLTSLRIWIGLNIWHVVNYTSNSWILFTLPLILIQSKEFFHWSVWCWTALWL